MVIVGVLFVLRLYETRARRESRTVIHRVGSDPVSLWNGFGTVGVSFGKLIRTDDLELGPEFRKRPESGPVLEMGPDILSSNTRIGPIDNRKFTEEN